MFTTTDLNTEREDIAKTSYINLINDSFVSNFSTRYAFPISPVSIGPSISNFIKSSYPTSIPTSIPTSMPTLTIETFWENRLNSELSLRFDLSSRHNYIIYFDVVADSMTLYGGGNSWYSFVKNYLFSIVPNRELLATRFFSILNHDGPVEEFICRNSTSLEEISYLFNTKTSSKNSVECDGNVWKIDYCDQTVENSAPYICVNCINPCINTCKTNIYNETLGFEVETWQHGFSPNSEFCEFNRGYIKLFSMELGDNLIGPRNYLIAVSSGWFLIFFTIWWKWYYLSNKKIESNISRKSKFKSKISSQPEVKHSTINFKSKIISKINLGMFGGLDYDETLGVIYRVWTKLYKAHRFLLVFTNYKKGRWYGIFTMTILILYGFVIQEFIKTQYPFDDGACSSKQDYHSCMSVYSGFSPKVSICNWTDFNIDIDVQGLPSYQANCYWVNRKVEISEMFFIILICCFGVLCCRLFLMEPLLRYIMLPPTASSKVGNGTNIDPRLQKVEVEYSVIDDENVKEMISKYNINPSLFKPKTKFSVCQGEQISLSNNLAQYHIELEIDQSSNEKVSLEIMPNQDKFIDPSYIEARHLSTLDSEKHYQYDIEIRLPDDLNSKGNIGSIFSTHIHHRKGTEYIEELFNHFESKLQKFNDELIDSPFDTSAIVKYLNDSWGSENGKLINNKIIQREIPWAIMNFGLGYQVLRDYYFEYISIVQTIFSNYQEGNYLNDPDITSKLILLMFIIDLVGHTSYEAKILARRAYRSIFPRMSVVFFLKFALLFGTLACCAIMIYYTQRTLRYFPENYQFNWVFCVGVAVIIDFIFFENLDNLWYVCFIPYLCRKRIMFAKKELYKALEKAYYQSDEIGNNPTKISFKPRNLKSLNKYNSKTIPSEILSSQNLISNEINNLSHLSDPLYNLIPSDINPINATDFFFVSKKLAHLYPTLDESHLIECYSTMFPHNILINKITDNFDAIASNSSHYQRVFRSIYKFIFGGWISTFIQLLLFFGSTPYMFQRLCLLGVFFSICVLIWFVIGNLMNWMGFWYTGIVTSSLFLIFGLFIFLFDTSKTFNSFCKFISRLISICFQKNQISPLLNEELKLKKISTPQPTPPSSGKLNYMPPLEEDSSQNSNTNDSLLSENTVSKLESYSVPIISSKSTNSI